MRYTIDAKIKSKYKLAKRRGRDWFGEAYDAVQNRDGERVVLRIMDAKDARQTEWVDKLHRDIETARVINHPNLVKILDIDRTDGNVVFFAQEYLEGETLEAKLARETKIRPNESVVLILQVLSALHSVHMRKLAHGFLRPEAVFIARTEADKTVVKLTDFCIVDIQDLMDRPRVVKNYLSPEQALGQDSPGPRTDLFATGAILYEMLGGRRAYQSGKKEDVSLKIASNPPAPLGRIAPSLSGDLVEIVERAMDMDVDRRYADVLDMITDIAPLNRQAADTMSPASVLALELLLPPGTLERPTIAPKAVFPKSPPRPATIPITKRKKPVKGSTELSRPARRTQQIVLERKKEMSQTQPKISKGPFETPGEIVDPPFTEESQDILGFADEPASIDIAPSRKGPPLSPTISIEETFWDPPAAAVDGSADVPVEDLQAWPHKRAYLTGTLKPLKTFSLRLRQHLVNKTPVLKRLLSAPLATRSNQYATGACVLFIVLVAFLLLYLSEDHAGDPIESPGEEVAAQVPINQNRVPEEPVPQAQEPDDAVQGQDLVQDQGETKPSEPAVKRKKIPAKKAWRRRALSKNKKRRWRKATPKRPKNTRKTNLDEEESIEPATRNWASNPFPSSAVRSE